MNTPEEITVDYAKELGIDLDELLQEDPLHPRQVAAKMQWDRWAASYWAWRRLPAEIFYDEEAKMKPYVSPGLQVAIALWTLNATDSV